MRNFAQGQFGIATLIERPGTGKRDIVVRDAISGRILSRIWDVMVEMKVFLNEFRAPFLLYEDANEVFHVARIGGDDIGLPLARPRQVTLLGDPVTTEQGIFALFANDSRHYWVQLYGPDE